MDIGFDAVVQPLEKPTPNLVGTMSTPNLVVMGVSGCGKSTLGQQLAQRLGARYVEGDELHPPRNIELMAAGVPLTDADRRDWLVSLASVLRDACTHKAPVVVTCSALKRSYREVLRTGDPALQLVFLHGDADVLAQRMTTRSNHYMPPSLLASQLATLEPPQPDEGAVALDLSTPSDAQVAAVMARLSS